MCTTESTFAWVGVILVNAAFISFIAWGASTIWWFGFAISIVYTLILFYLARFVDRKSGWDTNDTHSEPGSLHDEVDVRIPDDADADDADAGYAASRSSGGRSMPLLANLLYGLFALSLGVTGYFLPVNIFYCSGDKSYPYQPPGLWTTNVTALPSDVQDWASSTDEYNQYLQYASFIYIPGENVTLFQGSAADSASGGAGRHGLWAAPASVFPSESAAPINFPGIQNPSQFILPGNGKACFSAYKQSLPPPQNSDPNPFPVRKPSGSIVACCDGKTLRTTSDNPSDTTLQSPHDFFVANSSNTLWWKDDPPYSGPRIGTGMLVYSIEDFSTMEAHLHSTFTAPRGYTPPTPNDVNDNDAECWNTRNKIEWQRSIMALFLCALPVTIVSVLLWTKRQAPSMAVTTFIGLSAAATFLFIVVDGGTDELDSFSQWWYSVSGALWMIVMTDLTFSKRHIARGPLIWGINFGALTFFVGMIILTGIFTEGQVWQWLVFNAFAVIPIAIFGISADQVFLLVLCAIGWLMDSVHIATLLSDSRPDVTAPVFFVVLGISGLLIAGAGWLLNQHEEKVREILRDYMKRLSISRRLLPAEFDHVALQTEDLLSGSTEISRHSGYGEAC
mmetsp:Transcript_36962/g.66490  ORF Transcript_36962/g.66490 Transcript_36962/m.66490 type:complete len:619 (+) Transcript_36962:241-2097(+)